MWCAAVVLYVMVTGDVPFRGVNVDDTRNAIMEAEPAYPTYLSAEIKVSRGDVRGGEREAYSDIPRLD